MTRIMTMLAIGAACSIAGCASTGQETPEESIQAIVALFEIRDFDTLVRTRYAEIGKAEGEAQIQILIDRFAAQFQDDDALASAISTYNSALNVAPEFSASDSIATFSIASGIIRLSRMADGKWGFHL